MQILQNANYKLKSCNSLGKTTPQINVKYNKCHCASYTKEYLINTINKIQIK